MTRVIDIDGIIIVIIIILRGPTSALLSRRACYVREGGSGVHTDQNSR